MPIIIDRKIRMAPGSSGPYASQCWYKYPSGILSPVEPGSGYPTWISAPYSGTLLDTAPAGFRNVQLASQSRIIYRSKAGSDGVGRGLSPDTPVLTRQAAAALFLAGHQNIVLLERGFGKSATYDLNLKTDTRDGLSSTFPFVVGWYGTGDRPVIELTTSNLWNCQGTNIGRDNILITGLHFWYSPHDPAAANHNPIAGTGKIQIYEGHQNIHIEDCTSEFIEWEVQRVGAALYPRNVKFSFMNIPFGGYSHKTSTYDAPRPSTMFVQDVHEFTTENCVFDYGGWHPSVVDAGANQYCHSIYHQYGAGGDTAIHQNNIFSRSSSHGLQARAGAIVRNNFCARNAVGLLIGSSLGGQMSASANAHFIGNVITEGWPMIRGNNACSDGPTGNTEISPRLLCTGAIYGLEHYVSNPAVTWVSENNSVHTIRLQGSDYASKGFPLGRNGILVTTPSGGSVTQVNNRMCRWNTDSQNSTLYQQPMTLENYHGYLIEEDTGAGNYDAMMQILTSRPIRSRDSRYETAAINEFCRVK